MSLHRLAHELDETARQTSGMVEEVAQALSLLTDESLDAATARAEAARIIVHALQGQDRIEQRCRNMGLAVRQFALLPPGTPAHVYDEIWSTLVLDELRVPGLSGIAAQDHHGEVELF